MVSPAASISVVLPIQSGRSGSTAYGAILEDTIPAYMKVLEAGTWKWEILLVPDRSAETLATGSLGSAHDGVRVCAPAAGWGAAVRAGLRASEGQLLCYTNYERTSSAVLEEMLALAQRNPTLVLRANRRTRDTVVQRLGSLLFNLECRALLGISAWDVNGTPKIFPRAFSRLLELTREDDLLDAEFCAMCERCGYPVVEIPIDAALPPGQHSQLDYRAALRMYLGVPSLSRGMRAIAGA